MKKQGALNFDPPIQPEPQFYGPGYDPVLDKARLTRHCRRVLRVLERGHWYTFEELANYSGVPAGSVRTRVSNLRALGHEIETRTRTDRFREVRLV